MAELVTNDIRWKKGETGTHNFIIFESDGVTRKNITGITFTFKFWVKDAVANKGTAVLSATDAVNGEALITVSSGFTDTVEDYLGELQGDNGNYTSTFNVFVEPSAPA